MKHSPSLRDPVLQHKRVREHGGIIDLSSHGKIILEGADRASFLHGLVTSDVKKLREGEGARSVMTSSKGKMIAELSQFVLKDRIFLEMEREHVEKVMAILDRYHFIEDVSFKEVSEEYGVAGLHGPEAGALVVDLVREEEISLLLPDPRQGSSVARFLSSLPLYSVIPGTSHENQIFLTTENLTGEEGFNLFAPSRGFSLLYRKILQLGEERGLFPFDHEALETLRIEAGIPRFGMDMDENTIPIEARLDDAISYTKGCYLGQEVLARLHYQGHVNRLLTGLIQQSESNQESRSSLLVPARGDKIFSAGSDEATPPQEIGWITSACLSPTLEKVIALGYVRREWANPGVPLMIGISFRRPSASAQSSEPLSGQETSGRQASFLTTSLPFVHRDAP